MIIDAFGKPCPLPLMLAKKEIDAGGREVSVRVDNETAVKNLSRLGAKTGLGVAVEGIEGGYEVTLSARIAAGAPVAVPAAVEAARGAGGGAAGSGFAMFIGKDHVGEGDPELGGALMKMALYTLSQADAAPSSLLFMNSGVKLVCGQADQTIESVRALEAAGSEVLVCGTCLDFYGLKEDLRAGEVSNMYDILERMHEAAKVITL